MLLVKSSFVLSLFSLLSFSTSLYLDCSFLFQSVLCCNNVKILILSFKTELCMFIVSLSSRFFSKAYFSYKGSERVLKLSQIQMWEKWSEINALRNTSSDRGKNNLLRETEYVFLFLSLFQMNRVYRKRIIGEEEGWGHQITSALPFKSSGDL